MQLILRVLIVIFLFEFSGCVTFNNLDFAKSKDRKNQELCANLEFKIATGDFFSPKKDKIVDLSKQKIDTINSTLKNLGIDSTCTNVDAKKLTVLIHDKTSDTKIVLVSLASVFTVMSFAIIPTYLSRDMEITLMEGDKQILKREFVSTFAIWLPFAIKQWQDDSKSFDLYHVDAKSAILGLEIGKLLDEYAAVKR